QHPAVAGDGTGAVAVRLELARLAVAPVEIELALGVGQAWLGREREAGHLVVEALRHPGEPARGVVLLAGILLHVVELGLRRGDIEVRPGAPREKRAHAVARPEGRVLERRRAG